MREITIHRVTKEEGVSIFSHGPANLAGAQNDYMAVVSDGGHITQALGFIKFQNGPSDEYGHNGVTLETLLAVCHDRLTSFQKGPFPCRYSAEAVQHVERALEALKDRIREREHESTKARKQGGLWKT